MILGGVTISSCNKDDVVEAHEKCAPIITLALPEGGLKLTAGTEYVFAPDIQHSEVAGFKMQWTCNGKPVSDSMTYTFSESAPGEYHISIKASNVDGETTKEFTVEVVADTDSDIYFPPQSHFNPNTDRNTVIGRTLYLNPIIDGIENPKFTWTVKPTQNTRLETCHDGRWGMLSASKAGDYIVTVHVDGANTSPSAASVAVHVFESEDTYRREGGTNKYQNRVYEFLPAPGQFVNETATGGYSSDITTPEEANEFALMRLNNRLLLSLGAWGGYVVVGFDHSIKNTGTYDFAVGGNAFISEKGGSNEPGIVWVMQDTNGNGVPDDEWYQLRGSQTGKEGTLEDYWVTYYRPDSPKSNVPWTDALGNSGVVKYLAHFHKQDTYYPLWVESPSYTLRGTRLKDNNILNPTTGYWASEPFDWGYADNVGDDYLTNVMLDGDAMCTGFKISNAMQPDGSPVDLKFIDFVKVQTGVNGQSGAIGENSTEVLYFLDLN